MYVVIRAGGYGTRLWPLSRRSKPKQFHALLGNESLLRASYRRGRALAHDAECVFVTTTADTADKVRVELPELPEENLIVEPCGRGTGPGVALEIAVLATRLPHDALVATVPSDDFISNDDAWVQLYHEIEAYLAHDPQWVVAPSVSSVAPDTGFSYLAFGGDVKESAGKLRRVVQWVEKPNPEVCAALIASGNAGVHIGSYVWQLGEAQRLFERHAPGVFACARDVAVGRPGALEAFRALTPTSVEMCLTRHVEKLAAALADTLGWHDVGKWHVLKALLRQGDNAVQGTHVGRDTRDCLIVGDKKKVIATIGIDDLVIVDTPDALLVAKNDRSHEVKELLQQLESQGLVYVL